MDIERKQLVIVGCGPGDPALLTGEAGVAVAQAEVLVGAQRLLAMFPDSTAERVPFSGNLDRLVETVGAMAQSRSIAVLVSGDPGVCSLARRFVDAFGVERCRIIPGISSIQLACARLGLNWWNARIVSAHGRIPEEDMAVLARHETVVLLAGGRTSVEWVVGFLHSMEKTHAIWLLRDLSLPEETVETVTARQALPALQESRVIFVFKRKDMK